MRAKEWIENIIAHPNWGHVEIEWEAVEEIQDMLNSFQFVMRDEFKKCILSEEEVNKYQEALEYIAIATNGGNGIVSQLNALAELVNKHNVNAKKLEGNTYVCPVCHAPVCKFHSYCWSCGQYLEPVVKGRRKDI